MRHLRYSKNIQEIYYSIVTLDISDSSENSLRSYFSCDNNINENKLKLSVNFEPEQQLILSQIIMAESIIYILYLMT